MNAKPQSQPTQQLPRAGRIAWTAVGVLLLAVAAVWLLIQVRVVAVPLVIALFPAALLAPVSRWLKQHRVPPALAALLTVAGALAVVIGTGSLIAPLIAAELPSVVDAISKAVDGLAQSLEGTFLGNQLAVLDAPIGELAGRFGGGSDVTEQTLEAVTTVVETVAQFLLMIVAVFFYLKDGRRITGALLGFVPQRWREDAAALAGRMWDTLGAYFRGQLLVAFADAVGIALGLWILGVPLVLPLAVVVFVGALFPIVGAFVSGLVAVLVALASNGLVTALLALAVVLVVQQLEGNVLQPLILSKAINIHPLLVLAAIAAGSVTVGILGAFLAVPVAASIGRAVEYVRGEDAPAAADT